MRLREPYARKVRGKFGEWLADKMDETNMIQSELAALMHINQASVSFWQTHYRKPSYLCVMVLCMIFNDDYEKVWNLVEEDWA